MVCALGAAVCFGTASVLQAVAARAAARPEDGSGVGTALFLRAVRQWRYLAGLALDAVGFVLQIIALRHIPIYVVGAAMAASLAVTAVVSARLLRVRLSRLEWGAVGVVSAGLLMLGLASGEEGDGVGTLALKLGLLGVAGLVLLVGAVAGRLPDGSRALVLGLAAGTGFGVVEVAVRLVNSFSLQELLNPALYALLLGGAAGFLLLTSALQRGSVTAATAGLVLGETVGPAVVGVVWLGDRTREGLEWLAVLGFLVAVAGSLALARFGEPEPEPEPAGTG
ncbi:DMT family transporter [Streptomyces sp. NPDC001373]|uniref:DMT family transporter n=1 Tax=Streptomyces sp. NPDC001373 TaxID=3364565 RepID=UPI00368B7A5C